MKGRHRRAAWLGIALVVAGVALARDACAQTGEVAGMITEIKLGKGAVEVKPAGGPDWRPAGPLMSLLGGDTVRASGGGSPGCLFPVTRPDAADSPATTGPAGRPASDPAAASACRP